LVYEGRIYSLESNQIFVFGSNTQGRHGLGSAKTAIDFFGAKYGQASGLMGKSYGLITKDLTKKIHPSVSEKRIISQIHKLYEYAVSNKDKEFLIAYLAYGHLYNGYSIKQMAAMFANKIIPKNIIFNENFSKYVFSF